MIKVVTFENHTVTDVDNEIEDYIADHEIKRDSIILLKPYTAKGEDGLLYHYIKLVFENGR